MTSLTADSHEPVLGLGGAVEVVSPVDVHTLAAMELQQLLTEHGRRLRQNIATVIRASANGMML